MISRLGPQAGHRHLKLRVVGEGQVEANQPADHLAGHGGHGRPRHLHPWKAEQSEDEDGVQNQVDYRAGALNHHGVHRPAGGLDQPLVATDRKIPMLHPAIMVR